VTNDDPDRGEFIVCFLPWLATALQSDLQAGRMPRRTGADRHFEVLADSHPDEFMEGLSNARPFDFNYLVRVRRLRPPWAFAVGAVGAVPPMDTPAAAAVNVALAGERAVQTRTPRVSRPFEGADKEK